ncbi:unnamed protein product [Closterium sp. NIES-54]
MATNMAVVEEPLYPIAILIDELKNDDIQLRLNSIRRLSTIARALGEDRTRKELIPFLNENNDDDDEVLLAMAEELGSFIPCVGGIDFAYVILPPLETLCTVEETVVRDKAVESLCKIGQQMKPRDIVEYFVPLVQGCVFISPDPTPFVRPLPPNHTPHFSIIPSPPPLLPPLFSPPFIPLLRSFRPSSTPSAALPHPHQRLAAGDWFTARVSACGLFHIAYPAATEQQRAELRTLYGQLSHDDMPMVRRSAALNMGKFAATVEPQFLKTDILAFFKDLTNDGACRDSVRLLAVEGCAAVGKLLEKEECISTILPIILSFAQVKEMPHAYRSPLPALCSPPSGPCSRLPTPPFIALLRDNEAEVRIAAAGKVTKICAIVKREDAFNAILPCVKICAIVKREDAFNAILPCVKVSEKRFRAILPCVRAYWWLVLSGHDRGCVSAYTVFVSSASSSLLSVSSFPPAIFPLLFLPSLNHPQDLSTDASQHVRSALASVIMGMAPLMGKEMTIEHLLPLFLALLKDEFPDVRLNIISKLDQVNQVMGMDLLSQSLFPAIVELSEDRHWRVRLAIIEYIPLLAGQLGMEFFDEKLKDLCMKWLEDQGQLGMEFFDKKLKDLCMKWLEDQLGMEFFDEKLKDLCMKWLEDQVGGSGWEWVGVGGSEVLLGNVTEGQLGMEFFDEKLNGLSPHKSQGHLHEVA